MVVVHKRDGLSDEARIRRRLNPSNDQQTADTHTTIGTGPTRVSHSVHRSGQNLQHDNPKSKSLTEMPIIPTGGGKILGQGGE